jgi:hypothetical protein
MAPAARSSQKSSTPASSSAAEAPEANDVAADSMSEADAAAPVEPVQDDAPTTKADADLTRTTASAPDAEAPMSEADAPAVSAADDPANKNKVPITLAHPITNEEHQRRLRLDVKPGGYQVHDVIWLTRDDARAVIKSGLAQVDPENKDAVRAALHGESRDA